VIAARTDLICSNGFGLGNAPARARSFLVNHFRRRVFASQCVEEANDASSSALVRSTILSPFVSVYSIFCFSALNSVADLARQRWFFDLESIRAISLVKISSAIYNGYIRTRRREITWSVSGIIGIIDIILTSIWYGILAIGRYAVR